MWQLLKDELNYSKTILIYFYVSFLLVATFVFAGPQIFNEPEIPLARGIRGLLDIIFIYNFIVFFGFFLGMGVGKRKRTILYLKLPVSVLQIGMVRIFFILFTWIGFVVVFFLFLLISGKLSAFLSNSSLYLRLCAFSGAIMFWTMYVLWMSDLKTYIHNKKKVFNMSLKKMVSFFVNLSFILLYLFFLQSGRGIFTWLFESVPGVLFFLLLGAGGSLLSVVTFAHRKSYVE